MLDDLFIDCSVRLLTEGLVDRVDGGGATHFVAHDQQVVAVWRLVGRHELQAFRTQIASGGQNSAGIGRRPVLAGVQVVGEHRIGGIGDVVSQHAAHALQANELSLIHI